MKMDAGLDTGPILTERRTAISEEDTAQTLHDRLATMGAELLVETIPSWVSGRLTPRAQPEGATYARKIEKSDGLIDWNEAAAQISRKVRAFTPWPGAYTFLEANGQRRMIKVLGGSMVDAGGEPGAVVSSSKEGIVVATGSGAFCITALQPEGRKRMAAHEFLTGHPLGKGQVFTR